MRKLVFLLIAAAIPFTAFAQFSEPVEIKAASEINLEKARAQKELNQALWGFLQESRVPGVEPARIHITLDESDRAILEDPYCETCLFRKPSPAGQIGVNKNLDLSISLRQESLGLRGSQRYRAIGETAMNPQGDRVWTTSLQSDDATALRLHFTNFDLPEGIALFLYNDAGQAHGPYTGKGPNNKGSFWSHTVFGDHVWIQVQSLGGDPQAFDTVEFNIAAVSHIGPEFALAANTQINTKADCSANVDCVLNVNCYEDQTLSTARKAIARIVFTDEGGSYTCSGGLMNDSNGAHRKPWFLTARHCISSQASADTVQAFFQYQSPCGSCSASYSESILGSTLWAKGPHSSGDFALLELSQLPSSWGLMGLTTANVRDSVGAEMNCLSHPKGSPQSYSRHVVQTSNSNIPAKIINDPILGTTEGGSSGAPMFLDGGSVVGVVSVTAYPDKNTYDLCDTSTFEARAGALSYFWSSVRPYLYSTSSNFKMRVADVAAGISELNFGSLTLGYRGKVTITVVDELGNTIPFATVTGSFSNGLSGTYSATTNDEGQATIFHSALKSAAPSFTFCVSDITQEYFDTYDSAANTVTCATR